MKKIVFVLLQCLIFISLSGRDSGYAIRNYTPKEYGGFNQVWCSLQDKNGVMYFGTSTNIFAYDGKSWTPIPVVAGNAIRSMWLGDDGIIYVGSYGSFGYLEKQISGALVYRTLSDQLPASEKKFTDVWKTYSLNGEIVFQTSEAVYFFKNLKYLATVLPSKTFALSFLCKGHLYIRQRETGIQEIINHKLQLVPGGERFADERCLDIIPWKGGKFAVLTGDSGFYSFSPVGGKGFYREKLSCNDYLRDCFVLGTKYVDDHTIAVYSRNGIGLIDLNGNLLETLNTDDGLIDNSVSSIQIDSEGQLWLTTGNGISHVFYQSTARYLRNKKAGFDGDVNSIADYKNHIYLATTAGLYRSVARTNQKHDSFELVGFEQTELWAFVVAGEDLLVGTSGGTFVYREGKPVEYISTSFTRDIIFNRDSTLIYCAELGGVRTLKKINNKWETVAITATPGEQQSLLIAQYNYTKGERLWTIGQSGILYRIDYTAKDTLIRSYSKESGINERLTMFFIVGDSVCAKTVKEVYIYDATKDKEGALCFFPSQTMKKTLADRSNGINFTGTEKGKLIRNAEVKNDFSIRSYGFFKQDKKTGLYNSDFLDLPECGPDDFIFSYVDSYGNFWVSFSGMVVHFDVHLPLNKHAPYETMISRVIVGEDSLLFAGVCNTNLAPVILAYRDNSVIFRFTAPTFNHEELTLYSYYLEGFDKDTSQLLTISEKEYTNLPEGDYVFVVRSVNVLGTQGKVAQYHFTILPPWYRTLWAYCIYFTLFAFTIFVSIRLGARRLRKQKERLEVIVAERTMEVVEQKQKIEAQNFELESAYKGIQDSIHYAERIQHAILPVASEIHNSFPDAFVFFRPRDIVSGDFYWMVKRGNLSWIACVDCTGHGVPGAFMSMIGNTLLNEIVLEKNIESPHKILDLLHIRIRQALRQDAGGETRDGMDISLCVVDSEKRKLNYAGANRALWLIRNNELIVLPPDKFSIGGDQWDKERHFTLHEIDLAAGDCIYMSSDGYADQFGGPRGKKFMVKRFQQLLMEIHALPMEEQKVRIENAFDEWKNWTNAEGNTKKLEQVDDVLVIGFRVK
jgi:serine phosphatase RsbU (regulator of sigma subunit)